MASSYVTQSKTNESEPIDELSDASTSNSVPPVRAPGLADVFVLKPRLHHDSTSSSTSVENVRAAAVPMTSSRQHSVQGGGILNTDSVNYPRFHQLRRVALWCCLVSFLLDIGLGLTSFINCVRSKSFVGFSYSVDTLMDSLCAGFVSWHLNTKSVSDMHHRDRLACCVIGALFIGSFLAIESRAIQSMILAKSVRPDVVVFTYSLIHIVVFTVLSILKIAISKQIKSTALMADALNSIIGLIMSFPLLFWDRVTFLNKFANLDDLVQVLMAIVLFVAGWNLILDSITTMNAEYARTLREGKLQRMLKDHNNESEADFDAIGVYSPSMSIAPIAGTRRFSFISNR